MADASSPVVPSLLAERVAAQPVVVPKSAPSPPQPAAVRPGMHDSELWESEPDEIAPVADWDPDVIAPSESDAADWDPDEIAPVAEVDVEEFRAAPFAVEAPHVQIAGPVFDSPLERLGLEAAQVSDDLFPDFLRPEQAKCEIGESPFLRRMQDLKARAFEHVRYRVVEVSTLSAYAAASLGDLRKDLQRSMKSQVYEGVRQVGHLGDLHNAKPPGSARDSYVTAQVFLDVAHRRGLEVTNLKQDTPEARDLQAKYAKLIERLPRTVYDKCGTLTTPVEKFTALAKLINKHSGELVAKESA